MRCAEVADIVVSVWYRRGPEHPSEQVRAETGLPVWATGGVSGAGQVREALTAGAQAVTVGPMLLPHARERCLCLSRRRR